MKAWYVILAILLYSHVSEAQYSATVPSIPTYYGERLEVDSFDVGDLLNQTQSFWVDIENAGRLRNLTDENRATVPIGESRRFIIWQREIPNTEFSIYESLTPEGADVLHAPDVRANPLPVMITNRGETSPCLNADCIRMNSVNYVSDKALFSFEKIDIETRKKLEKLAQNVREESKMAERKSKRQTREIVAQERQREALRAQAIHKELEDDQAIFTRWIGETPDASAAQPSNTPAVNRMPGFSQIYWDQNKPQVIADPQPN